MSKGSQYYTVQLLLVAQKNHETGNSIRTCSYANHVGHKKVTWSPQVRMMFIGSVIRLHCSKATR